MSNFPQGDFGRSAPYWLRRIGVQSWLTVGFVLVFAMISALFSIFNEILIPFIISILLAILCSPLVDWFERHKVSRSLGTIIVMILILLAMIGFVLIFAQGILQQGSEITRQLQAGWASLQTLLEQYDIALPSVAQTSYQLSESLPIVFQGLFGFLGDTLATVVEIFVGLYFGIFILFFLLRDTDKIQDWISKRIRISPQEGANIVDEMGETVFVYFRGTALTALITSVVVAIPLIILRVPLVGSILVIYFVTSFIPYLGAWIAGAFAVLIALGAGGVETALIILIAVIISNGILQSVVSSWALGSMLKIYPLLIFLVTIAAGIVGGILLMVLAVPLTAIAIQIGNRLSKLGEFSEEGPDRAL